MLWETFFDDESARPSDKRRDRFHEFAEYLVDIVIMYQNKPTDIGGQLPKHRNVHLLFATMVTIESSVDHTVVGPGPRHEVGLLQCHGEALVGYDPATVRRNPRLGLLLGIRWAASKVPKCPRKDILDQGWDDYDWLGPLSLYAGGAARAKRKNGTCKHFPVSRKRVDRTLMYRTRIDYAFRYWKEPL